MLRTLAIRDFAIVESVELEFDQGFTVLTGETGAGKSILIDAIGLLLGDRADASVVREGSDRADLSASYDLTPACQAWLTEQDLDHDDALLLRRTIDRQGRSKAWINGRSATLSQLREVGELIVEIHGQHEHQLLLREASQRALLDEHGASQQLAQQVAQAFKQVRQAREQLQQLQAQAQQLAADRDRVAWMVDDLSQLKPMPGEWEQIDVEHRRLSHAAALLEGAQATLTALSEDDDSVQSRLGQMQHKLRQLVSIDPQLQSVLDALDAADIQISDACSTLSNYVGRADLDPQRLHQVTQRMDALHAAARRFRVAEVDLPTLWEQSQLRLKQLSGSLDESALRKALAHAEQAFDALARQLTEQRRRAAAELGSKVTASMQDLGMQGGRFEVALVATDPSTSGLEQVEFRVAGHAGATPRAITKVASGGELSRISLALAVVAAQGNPVGTLIFDEVDSGVGGAVGLTVGQLLRQLGACRQVLCITHLAQVASYGHQHLKVAKATTSAGTTASSIAALSQPQRITEIARMLGGDPHSSTSQKHAKELLTAAAR